jgi:hypothetical protein
VQRILQLRGPRALSESRLAKLLAALKKADPGARSLAAEYRYFVEISGELAAAGERLLERLLDDGSPSPAPASGALVLVVPRLGTISPWSSKASDIARNCGLELVRRIERGTVFYIEGTKTDLSHLLHDRMTQTVLRSFDEAAGFRARGAAPCGTSGRSGGESDLGLPERRRDRVPAAGLRRDGPRSHGRRAHHVRAGEFRALPAQDLQRRLDHRRRAPAAVALRHDPAHARGQPAGHGGRLLG